MLTQLTTVKSRLGIAAADTSQDALLTTGIKAVSARFDRLCNRLFARTVDAVHEFDSQGLEILPGCYPIESVSKFETKTSEAAGWVEQAGVDYVIRNRAVISLGALLSGMGTQLARVTYTGGYVLPGTAPGAGQSALPHDVEHAATEQVAVWYQNRDKLGLIRHWPSGGTYLVFAQAPLLPAVQQILRRHERWGG